MSKKEAQVDLYLVKWRCKAKSNLPEGPTCMASIPQKRLFSWHQIEPLGDLDRLRLVLEHLPDESLMQVLQRERGRGRDDHPVRVIWNSILAGVVFQHASIESLRRELKRNGQLRYVCGLKSVPSASAYTRFLQAVIRHQAEIDAMFAHLVEELAQLLPSFGRHTAIDGKALRSFAPRRAKNLTADGRRDVDADYGKKSYRGKRQDGTVWEKVMSWFGYRLHLIVDTTYELPLAFSVTPASVVDLPGGKKLVQQVAEHQPEVLLRAQTMAADKGYDDIGFPVMLYDQHEIKPIIDIRHLWRDGDETRLLPGHSNASFDQDGNVYCYEPQSGRRRRMANGGFEKDRRTLKKLCPARHYGVACPAQDHCPLAKGLRIPISLNRRIFTPIDRSSYVWRRRYRARTAVERVFSRLDVSFGFELHTIRGLAKMKMRAGLALCVMLAMALGHVRENRPEMLRRFVC